METQGFTIVRASMSKSKKHGDVAEFNGETALMQSEALQHLTKEINDKDRRDFVEHLQLRIVQPGPTANPDFVHIDLIDTPGLVDGGLNYPFDVNDAICKMAVHIADLVLIFLDPQVIFMNSKLNTSFPSPTLQFRLRRRLWDRLLHRLTLHSYLSSYFVTVFLTASYSAS